MSRLLLQCPDYVCNQAKVLWKVFFGLLANLSFLKNQTMFYVVILTIKDLHDGQNSSKAIVVCYENIIMPVVGKKI